MAEEVGIWVCCACTFTNDSNVDACCMCSTPRPVFSWCLRRYCRCISVCSFSGFLTNILSGALTCVFALVGSLVGAITGALAGLAAHNGLLRGAGLGAVAGAVLSVEVLEASRAYWHSQRSGFSSLPTMVSLMEMSYEELYDMLLPAEGRVKGASPEFLGSLPQHLVTGGRRMDGFGDKICCSICLQELEDGDIARTLPVCKHTFHLTCVDEWLSRRLLCPVCRQHM